METAPRSNEEDNTMTLPGNSLGPVNTVLITASLSVLLRNGEDQVVSR